MSNTVFFRGLLFALRERRDEFAADGDSFHQAFRAVLQDAAAIDFGPAKDMLESFDPVFGIVPEANEMLLEGERDFIVAILNPHLQIAKFKISKESAAQELDQLPQPATFRNLAARLDERLTA